ncbi:hypothetical protein M569_17627 [Genlisea aurea]|uniref:Glycine-rich protein n=1 Tax=Genlisea aurea TaxID=192259 RepID=S8BRZ7_9LAMI|nr:hypothetical protein M569_17627 [Genlisea aurea]
MAHKFLCLLLSVILTTILLFSFQIAADDQYNIKGGDDGIIGIDQYYPRWRYPRYYYPPYYHYPPYYYYPPYYRPYPRYPYPRYRGRPAEDLKEKSP